MTVVLPHSTSREPLSATPVVDVVIPVHNEEAGLAASVRRLREYLTAHLPYTCRITIVDNASTDATAAVADGLADEFPEVGSLHIDRKGRGHALRVAWLASASPVLAYMDVDLSTELSAVLPLVAPVVSGHSDLAIGSRLSRGSCVVRGPRRELISRGYNLLVKGTLRTGVTDAQCGFKAIRADVAQALVPLVEDDGWFFDTELLVLAERSGLRIHEVPVDWTDDPDSRVDVAATVREDLRGLRRLGWSLVSGRLPLTQVRASIGRVRTADDPGGFTGQAVTFAAIGVLSTLAYIGLFVAFRMGTSAQTANLLALISTAVANTAANRRLTFGLAGTSGVLRHQLQGLLIFAAGLLITSGSLAGLHQLNDHPSTALEVTVLTSANLVVTIGRFVAMREWIFHRRGRSAAAIELSR
jgi:glycosyltransferase involved in cell wall biosynthesis/putative flippase GtrA